MSKKTLVDRIVWEINDTYIHEGGGDNVGINIKVKDLDGKTIFEKFDSLKKGLDILRDKYGVTLVSEFDNPIYIDHKYDMVQFALNTTKGNYKDGELVAKK